MNRETPLFDHHKRHYFAVLDGMRGVAAITVGWLHAYYIFKLEYKPAHAFLAVDFFFCLSGFVISSAYDTAFNSGLRPREFGVKRFIRLYPMIFCGGLVGLIFSLIGRISNQNEMTVYIVIGVSSLLLLPAGIFVHKEAYATNNPIWSLFFESVGSAIYALERSCCKLSKTQLFFSIVICALLLSIVAMRSGTLESIGFANASSFVKGLARLLYPFFVGVLISRSEIHRRAVKVPSSILVLLLFLVLVAPIFIYCWIYELLTILFVFPIIIILGARSDTSKIWTWIWKWSGQTSYPFYIIHKPIIGATKYLCDCVHLYRSANEYAAPISLAIAVIAARFFLIFYDEPVRRWLTSLTSTAAQSSGVASGQGDNEPPSRGRC